MDIQNILNILEEFAGVYFIYVIFVFLSLCSIIIQLANLDRKLDKRLDILEEKINETDVECYKEIENSENANKYEFDDLKK